MPTVTRPVVRRRRGRRRPQRAGRRQPPRRRRLVGARARGAARRRRRGAQRPRRAPGLRARHVQRLLPAGGGLADDPVASTSRSTGWSGGTRRRCSATRCRDGAWALLHRDREVTAALLDDQHPGDGDAWLRAVRASGTGSATHLVGALLTPVPAGPGRARRCWRGCRRVGGLRFVKTLLTPGRRAGPRPLRRGRRRGCCSPATPGTPTSRSTRPGSGLMGAADEHARPDRRLPGARGRRRASSPRRWPAGCESRGGEIRCDAEVDRHRRATAAARPASGTADGERVAAGSAVVADVVAPHPLRPAGRRRATCPARVARACAASSSTPPRSRSTGPSTGRSRGRARPPYAPGHLPRRRLASSR